MSGVRAGCARERSLRKTRRRWRWAAVACVVLMGAWVCRVGPRAQKRGWLREVPTTVLLLAPVDVVGPMVDAFHWPEEPERPDWLLAMSEDLEDRINGAPLWEWQDAVLEWRLRGAAGAIDAGVRARSREVFDTLHGRSIELSGGMLTLEQLAREVQQQTGIRCRVIESTGSVPRLETTAGSWPVATVLNAIEGGVNIGGVWNESLMEWSWTIVGGEVVLSTEDALYDTAGWCVVQVHDLERVASWYETDSAWSCLVVGESKPSCSDEQLSDSVDLIEQVSPERFLSGGGRGSCLRRGRWLVVRAPMGLQVRIDALLRAVESEERTVDLGGTTLAVWGGISPWDVAWVVHDLIRLALIRFVRAIRCGRWI